MRSKNINSDGVGNGADSDFINRVLGHLRELQFYDSQTIKVEQTTRGTRFHAKPPSPAGISGYMGEYDQTNSYSAGQTFSVAMPTTIAGIQVSAGLYGVPPSGTDGLGTWAGAVPANPTGNAVPQDPLPTITAAPNNVWYARLVAGYCT